MLKITLRLSVGTRYAPQMNQKCCVNTLSTMLQRQIQQEVVVMVKEVVARTTKVVVVVVMVAVAGAIAQSHQAERSRHERRTIVVQGKSLEDLEEDQPETGPKKARHK